MDESPCTLLPDLSKVFFFSYSLSHGSFNVKSKTNKLDYRAKEENRSIKQMRLSPGKDFFCAVTTFPSWDTEETSQVLWRNESNLHDACKQKGVYAVYRR